MSPDDIEAAGTPEELITVITGMLACPKHRAELLRALRERDSVN